MVGNTRTHILVVYILGVSAQLIQLPKYSNYIYCLQEESTHFSLSLSTSFGLEASAQFWAKKSYMINCQYSQRSFELYQRLCIIFCAKISKYSLYTYYLQEKLAIFTNILNYTKTSCVVFTA